MKRTFLLTTLFAGLTALTLTSNSSGPANANNGNKTGGPGATGNCSSCHSGGSGATGAIAIRKKSDNSPADKYTPGEKYVVTVSGAHASLSKFGFQLMAVKEAGNIQAGTFGGFTNQHAKTVSGVELVEQHMALNKTGSAFTTEFDWTAPTAGTGNVKFYGILNAVNGDGTTNGDAVSPTFNKTLSEATNSIATINMFDVSIYPNPINDVLNIRLGKPGSYTLNIIAINGAIVHTQSLQNATEAAININLPAGRYFVEITDGQYKHISSIVKQ
jgi:hypothetical protein